MWERIDPKDIYKLSTNQKWERYKKYWSSVCESLPSSLYYSEKSVSLINTTTLIDRRKSLDSPMKN